MVSGEHFWWWLPFTANGHFFYRIIPDKARKPWGQRLCELHCKSELCQSLCCQYRPSQNAISCCYNALVVMQDKCLNAGVTFDTGLIHLFCYIWQVIGGFKGCMSPRGFKYIHFHTVLTTNLKNNRLAHLLWELAPLYGKSWIHHCKWP